MDLITIIGLATATGTTGSFLPQTIKTIKTKQTKDLSLPMYIMVNIGVVLWISSFIFIILSKSHILNTSKTFKTFKYPFFLSSLFQGR